MHNKVTVPDKPGWLVSLVYKRHALIRRTISFPELKVMKLQLHRQLRVLGVRLMGWLGSGTKSWIHEVSVYIYGSGCISKLMSISD